MVAPTHACETNEQLLFLQLQKVCAMFLFKVVSYLSPHDIGACRHTRKRPSSSIDGSPLLRKHAKTCRRRRRPHNSCTNQQPPRFHGGGGRVYGNGYACIVRGPGNEAAYCAICDCYLIGFQPNHARSHACMPPSSLSREHDHGWTRVDFPVSRRGSLFAVIDAMEHTVIPSKSCFIVLSDP